MRARILTAAVVAALAAAPTTAATADGAHAASPVAHAACTRATIGGRSKCIARGQYCSRSHKRDYQRYGLRCTKHDANGRWHLQ